MGGRSAAALRAALRTGLEIARPDQDAFGKDLKPNAVVFNPVTGQLWYDSDPDNRGVKRRAKDELWKKLGY